MRILLICLVAACIGDAGAQIVSRDSVHLKPLGTVVSGSFVLVNRTVPLPEGEFVLAGVELRDSRFVRGDYARAQHKMVHVSLGQMDGKKLRAYVWASTVVKHAGTIGWVTDPCAEDKVALFKLSRVPYMKRNYEQNCLVVNRHAATLGDKASGEFLQLANWVRERGGETPIRMIVDATVTRIAVADYLMVRYVFNPAALGCAPESVQSQDLVDGVVEFGKVMQEAVNEGFSRRSRVVETLAAGAPRLENCRGAPPRTASARRG